jgi:hypothetical protein
VVAFYDQHYTYWFTEGKGVVAGKVVSAFAMVDKWLGTGGMNGQWVEIEMSADMAGNCVQTGIANKLPAGGKLAQLATSMLEHTQAWFQKVHKHLDSKLMKLTQMGILEEEALILLSEEIIIMYDRFYPIWCKRMEFIVKGTRVDYMACCIWLTMQVHMAMDDFVHDGMKYNAPISSAFIRFLTKQTGSNVGTGVVNLLSKLEEKLRSAEKNAKDAITLVNKATKRATSASTMVDKADKGLAKSVHQEQHPQEMRQLPQGESLRGRMFGGFTYFIGVEGYHPPLRVCCCCWRLAGQPHFAVGLGFTHPRGLLSQTIARVF